MPTSSPLPDGAPPSLLQRWVKPSIWRELVVLFGLGVVAAVGLVGWMQSEFNELNQLANHVNIAGRLRMLSQRTAVLAAPAAAGNVAARVALSETEAAFDQAAVFLRNSDIRGYRDLNSTALDQVLAEWNALRSFVDIRAQGKLPMHAADMTELARLADATLQAAETNVQQLLPIVEAHRKIFDVLFPVSLLLGVLLLLSVMTYVRRRILNPLRALESQFRKMATGDLSARVTPRRADEVGRLITHANISALSLEQAHQRDLATLAQLTDSETRHRTLWEIATEAIVTLNTDNIIVSANPAVERTFGYAPDELIGQNISVLQPEHLRAAHIAGLARYLGDGQRKLNWRSIDITALHRDGHEFPVELSFSEMQLSDVRWFVGTFRDITERKRHEEELELSANYDSLTGLPNRTLLMDRIDQAILVARRHSRSFGVLYLDLDNFKVINDSLGHETGDELLREAARRLQTCVREGDSVARVGGDEFVLLLSELAQEDDIDQVAQRALMAMERAFHIAGSEGFVGASIGGSIYPEDGSTRAELLQHADIAMYRAKEYGRNNFQRYAGHMKARFRLRMSMESQLRKALDGNELVLHYQPQIELASGRVIGAEALVRWESPTLGRVSPAQFIPLAEETGLIVPIGKWIIDRACRDAATWILSDEGRDCTVAINLSARQFNEENLIDVVAASINECRLPASRVELEITESLVMQNPERASSALQALKRLGCKVALDDFGTGYSSLAYLRTFPLDCLKIDKSLIQDVAIVRAVIQLAKSFGLKTLAEGVEDEDVLSLLRHLGCDIIQGYHYSRPLPLADFRQFLLQHNNVAVAGMH